MGGAIFPPAIFSAGEVFFRQQQYSGFIFFSVVRKMAENPIGFLPHPRLFKDKHFSLLRIFPDYGRKKFYNNGARKGARTLSLMTINLTTISVQFRYAECRVFCCYAEYSYAECRGALTKPATDNNFVWRVGDKEKKVFDIATSLQHLTTGPNVIKRFTAIIYECSSLARVFA